MCGPADPLGLRDQPVAHQADEVGDVDVDGAVGSDAGRRGALCSESTPRPVTGRFEAGEVVVGVEVAVGGVAGVPGLRRPHPVADLQIAAEGQHVVSPTGRPGAVSPCSDGPSTMKWPTRRRRSRVPSRVRRRIPAPRCRPGGPVAGRRRRALRSANSRSRGAAAAGTDGPAVRRAVPPCRRRSIRAAAGWRRAATGRRSPRSAWLASPYSRIPNRRNAFGLLAVPGTRRWRCTLAASRPAAASWPASGAYRRGSGVVELGGDHRGQTQSE